MVFENEKILDSVPGTVYCQLFSCRNGYESERERKREQERGKDRRQRDADLVDKPDKSV